MITGRSVDDLPGVRAGRVGCLNAGLLTHANANAAWFPSATPGEPRVIEMDAPSSNRRAARKATGSRRRLPTEWVMIPLIIVSVLVLVFGLRFLVG